uniref:Protein kinase domain-containing protein n=1 Tax=Romanomermis culicivorax TaxID=13658 RepID=A0A915K8P6_ROMCU
MEWNVLLLLQKKPHCPEIYKCGMTDICSFMTMQLLGHSLSAIRRKCKFEQRRFSLNATFRVTAQCVIAIRDLHKIGFLHRDIKPSNFAIGADKQSERKIYMLDFGLCRGFVGEDNRLKPERPKGTVGFRGTARYASMAAHRGDDLSRRDDLWSLFYTFIELLAGILPWRSFNEKNIVFTMKKQFTPEVFCRAMMPEVSEFVDSVGKLSFADEPNYEKCASLFETAVDKLGFKRDDPYDWQLEECLNLPHWKPPPIP